MSKFGQSGRGDRSDKSLVRIARVQRKAIYCRGVSSKRAWVWVMVFTKANVLAKWTGVAAQRVLHMTGRANNKGAHQVREVVSV